MFFIAFILDAAFSLSLCGFLIMHGRMVAQVHCSLAWWRSVLSHLRGIWVELKKLFVGAEPHHNRDV